MSDIQAIKYRLVGAVVIVVGFALVWWLMLDHEAHRRIKEEQADLPPQTFEVERFDIEEPDALGIRPDNDSAVSDALVEGVEEIKTETLPAGVISPHKEEVVTSAIVEKTPEAKIAEIKPAPEPARVEKPAKPVAKEPAKAAATANSYSALDNKGLPESWVIQLASVKSRENAQQLQRKLLASSFPAYVKSVSTPEGTLHRVLVGPKLSRQKAEETASAIEKEFRIKGMIVRFQTGYEQ